MFAGIMSLILTDSVPEGMIPNEVPKRNYERQKNAGLATVTLNLRSQPRLPGSVVGDASMAPSFTSGKIT